MGRSWPAWQLAVLACLPFLLSGTCYYSSSNLCAGWHTHSSYSHCHTHVGYHGHSGSYAADHDHSYYASHAHPWTIREFRSATRDCSDGVELARIYGIRGIDLGLELTGGSDDSEGLREATRELREVNAELLSAPVGLLVFHGVEYGDEMVRVVWRQIFDGSADRTDGFQVFVLDYDSRLLEVHNLLWRNEPR